MNVSRESMLALQRHFVGALSVPSRTWLELQPWPRLAFAGDAVRTTSDGCVLDFGSVASPGAERRRVRVFRPGSSASVSLADKPSWLEARFIDATTLEIEIVHDVDAELTGALRFAVAGSETVEELPVRMVARRAHPIAQFDFNGSSEPLTFDFGASETPYRLTVTNDSSTPLVVTFANLPAWLSFEIDGARRNGPAAGPFFERTAPFTVELTPHLLGRHFGTLRIRTNDPRPELRTIELRFAACLIAAKPYVRAIPPAGVRLRADQTATAQTRLENWGRLPAHTHRRSAPKAIDVGKLPVVPAAAHGNPGSATLPIRILPARLAAGRHRLSVVLAVDGGEPAAIEVPLNVEVLPAEPLGARLPAETIAAVVALLVLTVLFVLIVRGLL